MSDMGWPHLRPADKESILRGVRDGQVYGGPYHVEIYPADRCNIDCFFCSTAAIRGTDELPLQRIEELIDELHRAGTRSIRLSGGGEPLFHRSVKPMLQRIADSGIPIENLTTNAVLLGEDVARLLVRCCDMVTISLNTADQETYATMMKTPARNFDRVLANVRQLIRIRSEARSKRPIVQLQYLVWKDNYKTIPRMYELARELGADRIIYNGLSSLPPEKRMSDAQIAEMMSLYEDVIRIDEFRHIQHISSFERDLTAEITSMIHRVAAERQSQPLLRRIATFFTRAGTLREKVAHNLQMKRNLRADAAVSSFDEACVIGWYSLVIRSDGTVAPCCILQGKPLGNVFQQSVEQIWNGEGYQRFRRELTGIIEKREQWTSEGSETVEALCAAKSGDQCPMRSYFFIRDTGFVNALGATFNASHAASRSTPEYGFTHHGPETRGEDG